MNIFLKYFPYYIVLITYYTIAPSCIIDLRPNATGTFILNGIIIFFSLLLFFKKNIYANQELIFKIYIYYILFEIIRSYNYIEVYAHVNALISNSLALLVVAMIPMFKSPLFVQRCLRIWLKYIIPLFYILYFTGWLNLGAYHWMLFPLFFIVIFIKYLNWLWRIVLLMPIIMIIPLDSEARSQVVRALFSLVLILLFFFKKDVFGYKITKYILFTFILLPYIFLLYNTLAGYNIFTEIGDKTNQKYENSDTRTFLYEEAISSSINGNYVLLGRTPARGHDTEYSWANTFNTKNMERSSDECGTTTLYTWLGLIGLIIFSLINFYSIRNAYIKSRSISLKVCAFHLCFVWVYFWIETFMVVNIITITIVMLWGICTSESFQSMSDQDFKRWFKGIVYG